MPDGVLDGRSLLQALQTLGQVLTSRGRRYEVVAVGGSVLLLLGYVQRGTRDLDLVALVDGGRLVSAQPLPQALADAAADVANALGLRPDWLNAGPASLMDLGLPEGFMRRVETRTYGGITLHLAGRRDLIALKLYAAVDHGPGSRHTSDLRALAPTAEELRAAAIWTRTHDPSEGFRSELSRALMFFGVADDVRG